MADNKEKMLNTRITAELYEQLQSVCETRKMGLSEAVRDALLLWMDAHNKATYGSLSRNVRGE